MASFQQSIGFSKTIQDPDYFHGRQVILSQVSQQVKDVHILLGGPRSGKSSVLRALEWSLLGRESTAKIRFFPVYIDLEYSRPNSFENLLFILVERLRDAVDRWKYGPGQMNYRGRLADLYSSFIRTMPEATLSVHFFKAKLKLPEIPTSLDRAHFRRAIEAILDDLKILGFDGALFLLDEADFVVRQRWADDAWKFLRGLVESDERLRPYLGIALSGYRTLDSYRQPTGSPLVGISLIHWLKPLTDEDVDKLTRQRLHETNPSILSEALPHVRHYGGGNPAISQRILTGILGAGEASHSVDFEKIAFEVLIDLDREFAKWWGQALDDEEREIYKALDQYGETEVPQLRALTGYNDLKVGRSLVVLLGCCIINARDNRYAIGARIFQNWVAQQAGAGLPAAVTRVASAGPQRASRRNPASRAGT